MLNAPPFSLELAMLAKTFKLLGLSVLGLALLLVLGGLLLSPKFTVSRSVDIAAPAEKIYPLIASPRQWKHWSVWNQRDPAMKIEYSGPESGAGAVWAWRSQSEGDGKMSFISAEAPKRVAYELYFPDFGTTSTGELRLDAQAGGTRVTWSMDGDMGKNPLFRWVALFADGMVGSDFAAGLAGLKLQAEKKP